MLAVDQSRQLLIALEMSPLRAESQMTKHDWACFFMLLWLFLLSKYPPFSKGCWTFHPKPYELRSERIIYVRFVAFRYTVYVYRRGRFVSSFLLCLFDLHNYSISFSLLELWWIMGRFPWETGGLHNLSTGHIFGPVPWYQGTNLRFSWFFCQYASLIKPICMLQSEDIKAAYHCYLAKRNLILNQSSDRYFPPV